MEGKIALPGLRRPAIAADSTRIASRKLPGAFIRQPSTGSTGGSIPSLLYALLSLPLPYARSLETSIDSWLLNFISAPSKARAPVYLSVSR